MSNPFPDEAVEGIYQRSKGVPRHALKLCGTAWHIARGNGLETVPVEAVNMAAQYVEDEEAAKGHE